MSLNRGISSLSLYVMDSIVFSVHLWPLQCSTLISGSDRPTNTTSAPTAGTPARNAEPPPGQTGSSGGGRTSARLTTGLTRNWSPVTTNPSRPDSKLASEWSTRPGETKWRKNWRRRSVRVTHCLTGTHFLPVSTEYYPVHHNQINQMITSVRMNHRPPEIFAIFDFMISFFFQ